MLRSEKKSELKSKGKREECGECCACQSCRPCKGTEQGQYPPSGVRACGATSCPSHGLKAVVVLIAMAFMPKEIKRERAGFTEKTFVCLQRRFLKLVASFHSCSRADAECVFCATPRVFMLRSSIDPFYSNSMRNAHSMSEGLKMSL